jgi:hypothetical protein
VAGEVPAASGLATNHRITDQQQGRSAEVTTRRRSRRRYYGPLSPRRAVRHLAPWWLRWITGLCVAGAAVTACGGSPASPAGGSAPVAAQGNTLACRHYLVQYAWAKSLVYPTSADATKFASGLFADSEDAASGTPLARDLTTMANAEQTNLTSMPGTRPVPVKAVSLRVLSECRKLAGS